MKQKKGAVDLTDLAIGLVVLGIVVSIGAVILTNVRDARLTDLDTYSTANESSVQTANSTSDGAFTLDNTWVSAVNKCYNESGSPIFNTGNVNYTVSIDSGNGVATVSPVAGVGAGYNDTVWTCTYDSYNTSRPDWALPNNATAGLAEYGNWFDIIVIVGIAGLVLALIFMAFGNRGSNSEIGGSY